MPMNIIKSVSEGKNRASGGKKKKTEKSPPSSASGSAWLPSWLLAINQSVAESTLPARLSGASADNNVYY